MSINNCLVEQGVPAAVAARFEETLAKVLGLYPPTLCRLQIRASIVGWETSDAALTPDDMARELQAEVVRRSSSVG
jgi:hypothetical protein